MEIAPKTFALNRTCLEINLERFNFLLSSYFETNQRCVRRHSGLFPLFTRFRKTLNSCTDLIAYTLEKCPFLFFRTLCFCRIIKSPMSPFYMRRGHRAFISSISAKRNDKICSVQDFWINDIRSLIPMLTPTSFIA